MKNHTKNTLILLTAGILCAGSAHPMIKNLLDQRKISNNTKKLTNDFLIKLEKKAKKTLSTRYLDFLLLDTDHTINTSLEKIFGRISSSSVFKPHITFVKNYKKNKNETTQAIQTLQQIFTKKCADFPLEIRWLLHNPYYKQNLKIIMLKAHNSNKSLAAVKLQLLIPLVANPDLFFGLAQAIPALYMQKIATFKTHVENYSIDFEWIFDRDFNSPLLFACRKNNYELTEYFLENKKLSVNQRNINGQTPLMFAAYHKNRELIKLILKDPKTNVHLRDKKNQNALHYAFLSELGTRQIDQLDYENEESAPSIRRDNTYQLISKMIKSHPSYWTTTYNKLYKK